MEELKLVNKEISIQLKELGFNWKCIYYLNKDDKILYRPTFTNPDDYLSEVPTQSLVCKWLRDVYSISVLPRQVISGYYVCDISYFIEEPEEHKVETLYKYSTFELAEEFGIIKSIEILKNKKDELD